MTNISDDHKKRMSRLYYHLTASLYQWASVNVESDSNEIIAACGALLTQTIIRFSEDGHEKIEAEKVIEILTKLFIENKKPTSSDTTE